MSTFGDIRAALLAAMRDTLHDVNLYGYAADNVATPAVVIYRPERVGLAESFPSPVLERFVFPVQLLVSRQDPENADDELDELTDRVVSALGADPTLGGLGDVAALEVRDYGTVNADTGIAYLACNVMVEVFV